MVEAFALLLSAGGDDWSLLSSIGVAVEISDDRVVVLLLLLLLLLRLMLLSEVASTICVWAGLAPWLLGVVGVACWPLWSRR